MLAIRLPEGIEERLDILAKATGRTKTFYAREAILEHLDDLEDIYLAEKRYGAVRSGKVNPVSLKNVMKQYDMED
jgi:RHH-type rel operon transcriptional repressor/antitoxin RelB